MEDHNRTVIKTISKASRQLRFCMCIFKFGQMVHSDFSRHSVNVKYEDAITHPHEEERKTGGSRKKQRT